MGNMNDVTDDKGTFHFDYNPMNLLTAATDKSSGAKTSFSYNNKGKRLKKKTPDGTTTIYVSDLYHVMIQPDNSRITKKYLAGLVGKEVQITTAPDGSDTTIYIHQNQVGSTLFTTNTSGKMGNMMFYKPYGELIGSDSSNIEIKYTGKEYNQSTGLYYYGARYYKPEIGRFISADNGLGGSRTKQDAFNRYEYVLGNPVLYNDPSGKVACIGAIGAGIGTSVFGGAGLAYTVYSTTNGEMVQTIGWTAGLVTFTTGSVVYNCLGGAPFFREKLRAFSRIRGNDHGGATEGSSLELNAIREDPNWGALSNESRDTSRFNHPRDDEYKDKPGEPVHDIPSDKGKEPCPECQCFTAGTLIKDEAGFQPIENISKGDKVFSFNETNGKISILPVCECYKSVSEKLIVLYVRGRGIETTTEHRFYVKDKGWVTAGNLTPGNLLITMTGDVIPIDDIKIKRGQFTVYNFRVDPNHTYYVTALQLLVHNTCSTGTDNGLGGKTELATDDTTESSLDVGTMTAEAADVAGAEAGVATETAVDVGTDVAAEVGVDIAAEVGVDIAVEVGTDVVEELPLLLFF